jgi:hypothetical protein
MITIPNKAKQFLAFAAKILVVGLAFWFIYKRLSDATWLDESQLNEYLSTNSYYGTLFFVLFLAFLNRFFEILKWRNLVSTIKPISVWEASKQELSAIVFSIFTPNGIGEYGAKTLFYPKKEAKNVIFLNFVSNGIQMIITVLMGVLGLLLLAYFNWLFIVLGGLTVVWILLFSLKKITIKGYSIDKLFKKIKKLPLSIHKKNSILGISRYAFFTLQQYLLYTYFGVEVSAVVLIGTIMAVYLIASCLPNFQFVDFMVKGGTAIYFFGLIGVNEWIVMIVTLLMWFFNVVLPISIGSVIVLTHDTKKNVWNS